MSIDSIVPICFVVSDIEPATMSFSEGPLKDLLNLDCKHFNTLIRPFNGVTIWNISRVYIIIHTSRTGQYGSTNYLNKDFIEN